MSAARALLVFCCFFIDVRVRAEEAHHKDCWGHQLPCAIRTESRRELKAKDFQLVLGEGALVEQSDAQTMRLVAGQFLLEAKTSMKFKTPYAQFWCKESCRALVTRHSERLNLKSLGGEWIVQRLGEAREYRLMSGLQLDISEVQTDGIAHMDFPQSLPWDSTVKEWAKLFMGSMGEFKKDVSHFREEWQNAVEGASVVQADIAARVLASHEQDLAQQRARRRAAEKEEQSLRRLFREKNDIDP